MNMPPAGDRTPLLLGLLHVRARQLFVARLVRFATAEGEWVHSTGPRGGSVWTRGTEKRYQKNKPGGGKGPSAAAKGPAAKPGKPTPGQALVAAADALAKGDRAKAAETLKSLTVSQIEKLQEGYGAGKGGQAKADKVNRLVDSLLASLKGGAAPAPTKAKATPTAKPATPKATAVPRFAQKPAADHGAVMPAATRPSLDAAEKAAAASYASGGFFDLNKALREGNPLGGDAGKVREGLDRAFTKAAVLGTPVRVRRGMSLAGGVLGRFLDEAKDAAADGGRLRLPGYLSTSTTEAFPGNVQLHVDAVHGLDLRPYSAYGEEDEMLLPHDSAFAVAGVEQDRDGTWHVHLKQEPPRRRGTGAR